MQPHDHVASLLLLSRDMMLEAMRGDLARRQIDPRDPELRRYLIASMGSLRDEVLRILFLDGGRRLVADEQMQNGSLSQLALYPRTIFRRALELNAAGMILIHNHPSGDHQPSRQDLEATRRLGEIGRAVEVGIVDHIVVTATHIHHIVPQTHSGVTATGIPRWRKMMSAVFDGS